MQVPRTNACVAALLALSCAAPPPRPVDFDKIVVRRSTRAEEVQPPAEGLVLDDACALLPLLDPELRLLFALAMPAEAAREFANRWPDPSFNIDLAKAVGAGGLNDELDMAFQIPLAIAGKQGARADQLDAEARLALARAEAVSFERARELERTWIAWSRKVEEERLISALARALEPPLERIALLEEAGALDSVDSGLLRLAYVDALRRERATREQAKDLELEIRHSLGLQGGAEPPLVPLPVAAPDDVPAGDIDRSLPQLAAAQAHFELAEAAVNVAHRARFIEPKLGLGGGREGDGNRVLFGLQIPIPLWNRGLGPLARAVAEREVSAQRLELAYERALEREERGRRRVRSAQGRRAALEEELVPLATKQVETLAQLLELGDLRPFLLVDAIERLHRTDLDRIELLAEELAAYMELRSLMAPAEEDTSTTPEGMQR